MCWLRDRLVCEDLSLARLLGASYGGSGSRASYMLATEGTSPPWPARQPHPPPRSDLRQSSHHGRGMRAKRWRTLVYIHSSVYTRITNGVITGLCACNATIYARLTDFVQSVRQVRGWPMTRTCSCCASHVARLKNEEGLRDAERGGRPATAMGRPAASRRGARSVGSGCSGRPNSPE